MAINWMSGSEIESGKEDEQISIANKEKLKEFMY
jgi:hypothetical protein